MIKSNKVNDLQGISNVIRQKCGQTLVGLGLG